MTKNRPSGRSVDDPLGKRALFAPPAAARKGPKSRRRADVAPVAGMEPGVNALHSEPPGAPVSPAPDVEVHCSGCGVQSRMSRAEASALVMAFPMWIPGVWYPRLLVCPACHLPTWCWLRWAG